MIKYVAGMNIKRWMTIFRDKMPYLGMFDNFFIHSSLYFGYENKQYEQDYPLRSKHDHALPDSAGIRASVHNILQAIRSIWRASHGACFLCIQRYNPVQEDHSLIRFHDEYGKLRFVIAPDVLIFIKSEDNYVQIHYLDKGRPKKFILRSSMRALEETLEKHGLVRCHRSYFINPSFIRIVHSDFP